MSELLASKIWICPALGADTTASQGWHASFCAYRGHWHHVPFTARASCRSPLRGIAFLCIPKLLTSVVLSRLFWCIADLSPRLRAAYGRPCPRSTDCGEQAAATRPRPWGLGRGTANTPSPVDKFYSHFVREKERGQQHDVDATGWGCMPNPRVTFVCR